jgi:hypothetical protein
MVLQELMIASAEEHNRLALRATREAQAARANGRGVSRGRRGWLRCRKQQPAATGRRQPASARR